MPIRDIADVLGPHCIRCAGEDNTPIRHFEANVVPTRGHLRVGRDVLKVLYIRMSSLLSYTWFREPGRRFVGVSRMGTGGLPLGHAHLPGEDLGR